MACQASQVGVEPPADEVFFPTGLAVDQKGDILFVTNGNADLRYNGGTLLALDIRRLREDIESFRTSGVVPEPLAGDERTACRRDVTNPLILECQAPRYAFKDQTIKLGNFGGQIGVAALDGTERYRLFVPVRGEPSLTWVSVDRTSGQLVMNCGNAGPLQRCAERYRIQELPAGAVSDEKDSSMPPEPYGLFVDEKVGALYLTSLATGKMSLFDIHSVGTDPEYAEVHPSPFAADSAGRSGAVGVAARPCRTQGGIPVEKLVPEGPCDPAQLSDGTFVYVTSHYTAEVAVFVLRGRSGPCDPGLGESDPCRRSPSDLRLVLSKTVPLNVLYPANDTRGIVFTEDGTRAFVVDRQPPGLVVLDTSIEDGLPRNKVLDAVALCPEPSLVFLKKLGGTNKAFVVCFAAGTGYVFDADALRLLDTVRLGQGPNAMVFSVTAEGLVLGFVANYVENDIAVLDLTPGSPTEHHVVARIGYPAPVRNN